ncbi:uncharacterized protein EDB91DRAFT_1262684 [Suillus paluster]|uniref:uncharacterized protein n=1 Tax=Suillus paluster TaxID=48578 RepID=UPI001B882246|nr:uncharacterized protein EDB91DRAFT_1262684 [Suillus paluster]KAG1747736.1 hypothetical protein EDB91DRAFT_1262684 [Suillus paluster]
MSPATWGQCRDAHTPPVRLVGSASHRNTEGACNASRVNLLRVSGKREAHPKWHQGEVSRRRKKRTLQCLVVGTGAHYHKRIVTHGVRVYQCPGGGSNNTQAVPAIEGTATNSKAIFPPVTDIIGGLRNIMTRFQTSKHRIFEPMRTILPFNSKTGSSTLSSPNTSSNWIEISGLETAMNSIKNIHQQLVEKKDTITQSMNLHKQLESALWRFLMVVGMTFDLEGLYSFNLAWAHLTNVEIGMLQPTAVFHLLQLVRPNLSSLTLRFRTGAIHAYQNSIFPHCLWIRAREPPPPTYNTNNAISRRSLIFSSADRSVWHRLSTLTYWTVALACGYPWAMAPLHLAGLHDLPFELRSAKISIGPLIQ